MATKGERQHKQNQSTKTGGVDISGLETSRGKNKRKYPSFNTIQHITHSLRGQPQRKPDCEGPRRGEWGRGNPLRDHEASPDPWSGLGTSSNLARDSLQRGGSEGLTMELLPRYLL